MTTGVSNYINRAGIDTLTNMPDATGFNMSGSGNPDRAQTALLDVHSQALSVLEPYLGTGVTLTPPGGGKVLVSPAPGQSDWGDPPAGVLAVAVVANTTYGRASSVGFGTRSAREDHDHGMPGEIKEVYFPIAAITSPQPGTYKYRVKVPSTLLSVRSVLGVIATTGLDAIFDVNVNGVSVIASGKPQIVVGKDINTNAQTFTTTALPADSLITVDVDQGSDGFKAGVIVELQAGTPSPSGAGAPIDTSWGPGDQGFAGWTFPTTDAHASQILTTGVIYIGAVAIRRAVPATNLWCGVTVTGSGLASNQSFMGLYSAAGTLLSATASMVTDFGVVGVKQKALTTPQALVPGIYYVAVVSNGTTPPTLARAGAILNALANVANLTAATARFATNGTGTSLPASLTMGSNVTTGTVDFWYAIS